MPRAFVTLVNLGEAIGLVCVPRVHIGEPADALAASYLGDDNHLAASDRFSLSDGSFGLIHFVCMFAFLIIDDLIQQS